MICPLNTIVVMESPVYLLFGISYLCFSRLTPVAFSRFQMAPVDWPAILAIHEDDVSDDSVDDQYDLISEVIFFWSHSPI